MLKFVGIFLGIVVFLAISFGLTALLAVVLGFLLSLFGVFFGFWKCFLIVVCVDILLIFIRGGVK